MEKREMMAVFEACEKAIREELKSLSDYQEEYCNWINSKKAILADMKKHNLNIGETQDIIEFSEYRNNFLCKKIFQMDHYLSSIERMKICLTSDETIDVVDMEEMHTKLYLMLTSMGIPTSEGVFDE